MKNKDGFEFRTEEVIKETRKNMLEKVNMEEICDAIIEDLNEAAEFYKENDSLPNSKYMLRGSPSYVTIGLGRHYLLDDYGIKCLEDKIADALRERFEKMSTKTGDKEVISSDSGHFSWTGSDQEFETPEGNFRLSRTYGWWVGKMIPYD